jgi:hypothetical protein
MNKKTLAVAAAIFSMSIGNAPAQAAEGEFPERPLR